jgi:hypothetical protein
MKQFPEYILNRRLVENTMMEVYPDRLEPVDEMAQVKFDDGTDFLDFAIDLELQDVVARQPNLNRALGALADYHRLKFYGQYNIHQARTVRFVEQGFAIGLMVCNRSFKLPAIQEDIADEVAFDRALARSYYHDIQPCAPELFEAAGNREMDALLEDIMTNTEPSTERLRAAVDYSLELEEGEDILEGARTTAAVVSYSLIAHEKWRVGKEWQAQKKKAAKAKKTQKKKPEMPKANPVKSDKPEPYKKRYLPFGRKLLEHIPMAIRREIEANEAGRAYWDRIKKYANRSRTA